MKPHELIQRRRGRRGHKEAPPQMRARNASAPVPAAGAPAAPGGPSPYDNMPARRPVFQGETRSQELARQRASAVVVRTGPAGMTAAPAAGAPHTVTQGQAVQPPPNAHTITMCGCTSDHPAGDCDNVATLRLAWPMFSVEAPTAPAVILDVCEDCAAAIKEDPIGSLVTGLQIWALQPPMHAELVEEDPPDRWGPHATPEDAAAKQTQPGAVTP